MLSLASAVFVNYESSFRLSISHVHTAGTPSVPCDGLVPLASEGNLTSLSSLPQISVCQSRHGSIGAPQRGATPFHAESFVSGLERVSAKRPLSKLAFPREFLFVSVSASEITFQGRPSRALVTL